MAMHADQIEVTETIAHRLIADQFPQWRELPVKRVSSSGTVNTIFRIGDDLVARFPLRAQDPAATWKWLTAEAAAADELAELATVPTPRPVAIAAPGLGFPLPWCIQTWIPGHDATVEDAASSPAFAAGLTAFISKLRTADTRDRRFSGHGRGGQLTDHDEWMATCFTNSEDLLDTSPLRVLWSRLRTLPQIDADVMCHGDLTPPNVLVRNGRLAGVLDCGGFAAADPALDLVSAWHLLDERRRGLFRSELECSEIQWLRGMAWALEQAMGLVWYYLDSNPIMSNWGRRTLERLAAAC